MESIIMLALGLTGVLSFISLLWFSYRYIDTYIGPKVRRISTRYDSLTNQTRGYTPINVDEEDFRISFTNKLKNAKFIEYLRNQIIKSGLKLKIDTFIEISVLSTLFFALVIYILTSTLQLVILAAILGASIPYFLLKYFVHRRQSLLEAQLPELLDFMARSLQVGHSLNTSLQMVSNESPMPISAEFKKVFEELNYGSPIEKVLASLADRIECTEIRFFVIAVVVNREIGGDLAEILKKVSKLIRERMELRQTIRVLTSEGRASGAVLGLLPFVIGILIFYINPEAYTLMMNDPFGRKLIIYAGILMMFGFIWMNRLCVIED